MLKFKFVGNYNNVCYVKVSREILTLEVNTCIKQRSQCLYTTLIQPKIVTEPLIPNINTLIS